MNQFPWWFHKLLLHYIPSYIVLLLEQPWIVAAIMSGFSLISILAISYPLYHFIQERRKRKKVEAEHALLVQRYEQLKLSHEQQHAATTLLLSQKICTLHTQNNSDK